MNNANVGEVWKQSLQLLTSAKETSSPLTKVWLDYLVPVEMDEKQFVFAVRLLQAKSYIETRYLPQIGDALAAVLGTRKEVCLVVDETAGITASETQTSSQFSVQQSSQQTVASVASVATVSPGGQQTLSSVASISQTSSSSTQQFTVVSPSTASSQAYASQTVSGSEAPPVVLQEEALPVSPYSVNSLDVTNSAAEPVIKGSGLSAVFAPDEDEQSVAPADPDERFSFSSYVMGVSNEFAYKASLRVAEGPGLYFNPLFIYGRSGLGKTHLLLAIKNYISTYHPDKRVVYAPTTEFVNDFTNAMAGDRDLSSFKRKYHTCDVLLIDDVQNLEGKEGTTDALFEIFNMFIEKKKQIVLSADRSPVEINLDERFTSRFASGITADIQPPNYEMKTAILKNYKRYYCNFLNIPEIEFSDEAIQKIVELSGSNIRELEGAVSNLIVFVAYRPDNQKNTPITYADVESVLGKSFFHKNTRRVDIDMVMRAVESYFKVSHAELLSDKRSKNISHPRQVAMYLIRRYTDMSYPEIGDSFNKDHTTVMYADRNIQAKMVEEVNVKVEVERIAEMLTM